MVRGAWLGTLALMDCRAWSSTPPLLQTHNHGCQNQSQAGLDLVCNMGMRTPAYSNPEISWNMELSRAWHTAGA